MSVDQNAARRWYVTLELRIIVCAISKEEATVKAGMAVGATNFIGFEGLDVVCVTEEARSQ